MQSCLWTVECECGGVEVFSLGECSWNAVTVESSLRGNFKPRHEMTNDDDDVDVMRNRKLDRSGRS